MTNKGYRNEIAIRALQGILTNEGFTRALLSAENEKSKQWETLAKVAYEIADVFIEVGRRERMAKPWKGVPFLF